MALLHRTKLWTFESLIEDLGIQTVSNDALRQAIVERVDIDGKTCKPGSLYIPRGSRTVKAALQNEERDVCKALENGAAIALTSLDRTLFPADAPVIQVRDLVTTAKRLAAKMRDRNKGTILGITGSVGKTTTKDMMKHVLSYVGPTYATRGNYNEIDGVLMTMASMPEAAKYSVIEICSTRPNSIRNKADIVKPCIGMVTVIGHSHGANYPSRYDILRDKVSMLDHLVGDRIAILGRSVIDYDQSEESLIDQKNIGYMITVGNNPRETVRFLSADLSAIETRVKVQVDGKNYETRVPLAGRQYIDAVLFTMAAAHALQLDLSDIAENISTLPGGSRRGERIRVSVKDGAKTVEVIDDAQNSSPESVRALMELLALRNPKRKILVLGDMLELGDDGPGMHDDLADDVMASGIDLLVTVGPLAGRVASRLEGHVKTLSFKTTSGAAVRVSKLVEDGDLIALKGSGGLELEKVLRTLAPVVRRRRASPSWTVEQASGRTIPITGEPLSIKVDSQASLRNEKAKIEDFGAFLYHMPLKKGFKTSRFTTTVSSNYVLTMRLGSVLGVGEASPRSIALTGDTRPLADLFFQRARPLLLEARISTSSAREALEDVRAIMTGLEGLAEELATEKNRSKPFRACLAGIDIMLLDGAARLHGMTLADFLGVRRPNVGVTATTLSVPKEGGSKLLDSIRRHLKRYPACRAKGMSDTELNLEILRGVRTVSQELSEDKIAWIDMNEAYTFEKGTELVRAISREVDSGAIGGTVILEQPLPKSSYREMCKLQALADIETQGKDINLILLADESLWDLEDLKLLQEAGGCAGINIKIQKCGGLLKAIEISELAHAFDPETRIYIGGMIGTSDLTSRALLNLAAALPRFDFITSGPRSNLKDHIVTEPLRWMDKSNELPIQHEPGLGLTVAWETLSRYIDEKQMAVLQSFLRDAGIVFGDSS